ncbi:TetR family transcriptional regulator C-terminal domain-containing protein [Pseudofrankia sp. BMG5.37]|uniref:TetR/AcrR family transcriptional regulator n=1 Tax=Pseudofrankia sp. BMG5.37 TaxID=3050035 RepID=UPI002893ED61|nr:TetR family transcriptional regulator C-terminal domain-containing protein [Pseudofrankia sp. BMG5.37]MDT3443395.1 TetR family transcriptional regulator C-terminal domain-containing protein [Pseudofrankia sp. BMG5.37]
MKNQPTTGRGRHSRQKIVDAASALIDDRGVAGAGLDQILTAAGASKSQLYHYFGDKGGLVRAVVADRFDCLVEAQQPRLSQLDSWTAIRAWMDEFATQTAASDFPGCPLGNLAGELAGRDEATRADLSACFERWQAYLTQGLERMRTRGELVPDAEPEFLALAVFTSLQGGVLLARTHRDVLPLRVALDAAYAHLRSFAAPQPDVGR